ncbi:hypothetical protein ACF063_43385 [Streptomyces chartreusis]|uniref:hypothetical protein n=1 Tax=Streptomyces chartreusis TaxID=1969 RepID=UPI0036F6AAF5
MDPEPVSAQPELLTIRSDPAPGGDEIRPVLEAAGCKQSLPAWGVTREFRFGQFIRLYDERRGANGQTTVTPIVLNADGDVVEPQTGSAAAPRALRADGASAAAEAAVVHGPSRTEATPIGLWEAENFEAVLDGKVRTVELTDHEKVISDGLIELDGKPTTVNLGPDSVAALRHGEAVLAVTRYAGNPPEVVRLVATHQEVTLPADRLNDVLAAREIESSHGMVNLTETAIRSLMQTGEAIAPLRGDDTAGLVTIKLANRNATAPPVSDAFAVQDLAEFLAAPVLPAQDGSMLRVPLDGPSVAGLREHGMARFALNGGVVTVSVAKVAPELEGPQPLLLGPAYVRPGKYGRYSLDDVRRDTMRRLPGYDGKITGFNGSAGATDSKPPSTPQFSRVGLPIAILLPWKQTWTLTGFTRGTLLSSLALAPGEETRITVANWERRAKALDQTSETDVEQTFDFTSTTRDTEDVFKEITQSNDFHAQANASLDASYSPGVASIRVHADGGVSNDQSLAVTARTSSQRMRESVTRAATRVRSRRVTRITESVERTSTNEVVRTIRNPNACHTLTLNFHEVLAHYDINVVFNPAAVRLVVLVPNPEPTKTFTELIVRTHESTLRAGLLDIGLADGFEACRLLSAYEFAENEIRRLAELAKRELDQDRQRVKDEEGDGSDKPPNPHLEGLVEILKDLQRRYGPLANSDASQGLKSIAAWTIPPPAEQIEDANRWLWRRLVAFKFGDGLLTALNELRGVVEPGPNDARRLVAATPALGSFPALDGLGGLTEKEKEDAGLFAASSGALGGPWWWWYPRLKDCRFYEVSDGGVPGLLAQLRTKFQEWETKENEGKGLEQAEAAANRARNEQQKATVADRLEMKFGAETVGSAYERREALLAHLNEHCDYYRFVLFQGMPPSEQLQRIMDLAPQLRVGMFEPHVVASDGSNLAIPLTPLAETTIGKVVSNLTVRMQQASDEALTAGGKIATDQVILTTPGVSVESWLGDCSGCEDHIEELRAAQARTSVAEARIRELEADRRAAMLADGDHSDPDTDPAPRLHVTVDQQQTE